METKYKTAIQFAGCSQSSDKTKCQVWWSPCSADSCSLKQELENPINASQENCLRMKL